MVNRGYHAFAWEALPRAEHRALRPELPGRHNRLQTIVPFVSEAVTPLGSLFDAAGPLAGAPALPSTFRWRTDVLEIIAVVRAWRSTKTDRGDVYLKRHWYEVSLADSRTAVIYFDRGAKRGAARWWLYSLDAGNGLAPSKTSPTTTE
jgi:hypothetical protein